MAILLNLVKCRVGPTRGASNIFEVDDMCILSRLHRYAGNSLRASCLEFHAGTCLYFLSSL